MNSLSDLNETYSKYSLAPTDNLISLWRSKIKVRAGHRGGEGNHIDASQSLSF